VGQAGEKDKNHRNPLPHSFLDFFLKVSPLHNGLKK
jgi:hypothetical protein